MKKQPKDICERNHVFSWGVGLLLVIFALIAVFFVNLDFLQNNDYLQSMYFRPLLLLMLLFVAIAVVRGYIRYLGKSLNHRYLKRFKEVPHLGAYQESRPKVFNVKGREGHAVLLLHGFTSAPQDFISLYPYLEQAGLSYYAPNIEGFGNNTTELLQNVRYKDWFRSALDAYDLLAQQYEKVSIVGHSLGSIMALYVAEQRMVESLVLTSPGVYSVKSDLKYKRLLQLPVLRSVFSWLLPYVPKEVREGRETTSDILDVSVARNAFQYLAVPVNSIIQVFDAQDTVMKELDRLSYRTLTIIYGRYDLTVDVEKFIATMHTKGFDFKSVAFLRSAHNILEDYDKAEVCFTIANNISH
jgi:esterase/lipase